MNNLIEDIYKTIEPLSDGQALDISEQQIVLLKLSSCMVIC